MSVSQLITLATGGATGVNRGRAMALRSRLDSPSVIHNSQTTKQRAFLDRLLSQPRQASPRVYDHPGKGSAHNVDRKKDGLEASDLAWLDRLPRDPAKVSVEDARTLFGLSRSLKLGATSQSDRRLVQFHLGPIKALHDRAEAEHNLRLASRSLPAITNDAVHAVVEALRNEDPNLDREFAIIQAQRLLDQSASAKSAEQAQKIRWAERHLAEAGTDGADIDEVDTSSDLAS